MLRKNLNVDGGIGELGKVRKRGSSSSSSSSLVRNYRLKRAILVGKRAGSSTPVPMWKMMSSRSPSLLNEKSILATNGGEKGKELSVSARKLAATLWEINGVSSTAKVRNNNLEDRKTEEVEGDKKDRILKPSKVGSIPVHCSDPSFSPLSEKADQLKEGCHRRRASIGSQKLRPSDCNLAGLASLHNAGLMEVDQNLLQTPGQTPRGDRFKHRLKDLQSGLNTSKELLKVLSHIWRLEEQQPATISLLSAFKIEIDRVCIQVNKLIHEQKSHQRDVDLLLQQFEEEKAVWKMKEKEEICITGELELEKKLKRQGERLNKKLGRELANTKTSLLRATKELEMEKRAREVLEQVSDELARGIGEDRAIVEQLTRESAKFREEVEKEREMLYIADVWFEERVQMKLLEAKYQFEEKNAIVDELRTELEAYLKHKVDEEQGDGSPNYERIKELEKYIRETLPVSSQYQNQMKDDCEIVYKEEARVEAEEEDSADCDLHSIELNMGDQSKSFKCGDIVRVDTDKMAMNGKSKGTKTMPGAVNIQKHSIAMQSQTSDGIEREFSHTQHRNPEERNIFEFSSKTWKKDCEDEMERYNMIKDLRDRIVSGSRIASSHEVASPKRNWDQHNLASQDLSKVLREAFGVLQEGKA